DVVCGSVAGGAFNGHTIGVAGIRGPLLANPGADIMVDNPNNGDRMRLTLRSGTVVDLVHTATTGNLTWTANPPF
ncbi:MAG: hypothetical protein MUF30_06735, partial [Burkholderiales bacterium]|nr:hypothetical protein [Burkholderiales bacterium]